MRKRITLSPLFLSTIAFLFITGCRKEKTEPANLLKERFPIEYQFINEGDKNVKSVILDMTTFYPYDSVDAKGDSLSFLNYKNTIFNEVPIEGAIKLSEDRSGYVECTGKLRLNIRFREPLYSPLYAAKGRAGDADLANGWTRGRAYVGDQVTIQSKSDGIIVFKWPSDTTKYKEVLYF